MTELARGFPSSAVSSEGFLLSGKNAQTPHRWSIGGTRTQMLYNRNAFFLSILPNGTIRSGESSNIFAVLQLYTVAASVVAIQARMTGYFLCMNYLSQLYSSKEFSDDCAFYEKLLQQYYTTFYSNKYKKKLNKTWYISIDKKGRPRRGNRSNNHQIRVMFLPLDADEALIKKIESEQRTKTGSNTSATTAIDAVRTAQPPGTGGLSTASIDMSSPKMASTTTATTSTALAGQMLTTPATTTTYRKTPRKKKHRCKMKNRLQRKACKRKRRRRRRCKEARLKNKRCRKKKRKLLTKDTEVK
ncbi:Fibroblast growth factor 20 [Octopus vulgaris]|uniref:Fibroblast growth factor n=2 Tax=Octopus TaxID=6643 RepID=A0AA36FCU3_OCTVU|nr:Fibroblast growth factor 20 [Octopus vulgaris]